MGGERLIMKIGWRLGEDVSRKRRADWGKRIWDRGGSLERWRGRVEWWRRSCGSIGRSSAERREHFGRKIFSCS